MLGCAVAEPSLNAQQLVRGAQPSSSTSMLCHVLHIVAWLEELRADARLSTAAVLVWWPVMSV